MPMSPQLDSSQAGGGTITWSSIPSSDCSASSGSHSPLLNDGFVRIVVDVDYNSRMEVKIFSTAERGKPIISRYIESVDGYVIFIISVRGVLTQHMSKV